MSDRTLGAENAPHKADHKPLFDAEEYWGFRDFKVWVVALHPPHRGRSRPPAPDIKYVRARTEEGAIKTAKIHTLLPRVAFAKARLATPIDLGITN